MPLISFVVPVYNKVIYVAETIQSLLNQTLKNIEVIVVNDHSTDCSDAVLQYYKKKDKRVRLYNLPRNRGRSYARNYGNRKAKSDIICVQDADDISKENRAKVIYEYFKRHKKIDVFYSSFIVINYNGKALGGVGANKFNFNKVLKTGEHKKTTNATYIGHSTMAYKKKAVLDVKYREGDWSKLGIDDWVLQMDLYRKGYKFGHYRKPLVLYRQLELDKSIVYTRNMKKVKKMKEEYLKCFKKSK